MILELVGVIAVSGFAVMGVLHLLSPGADTTGDAILDGLLLPVVATPLVMWRLFAAVRRDREASPAGTANRVLHGDSSAVLAGDAAWFIVGARLAYASVFGVSVLVGVSWVVGWSAPRALIEGLPTMKFNTAVCLALLSFGGLLSTCFEPPKRWLRTASVSAIAIASLVALMTLVEHALGIEMGIDTLASADPESVLVGRIPGRMSPATASALLFLAGGMVFGPLGGFQSRFQTFHRNLSRLGELLNAMGGLMGLTATVLFVVSRLGVSVTGIFATVAIHTAAVIMAVSAGSHMTRRAFQHAPSPDARALALAQLQRFRATAFALAGVLFTGLLVTVALMLAAARGVRSDREAAFVEKNERIVRNLTRSLSKPNIVLRDALTAATRLKGLSIDYVVALVASRDVLTDFPGVASFGSLDLVEARDGGGPRLVVDRLGWSHGAGDREGATLAEDSAVVSAAAEALATGRVIIAERPRTAGAEPDHYELIYFLRAPVQPEPRARRLLFATWRPAPLSFGPLSAHAGLLNLELFTGDGDRRIFGAPGVRGAAPVKLDQPVAREPLFTIREPISVKGHDLMLLSSSTPGFEAEIDYMLPITLGIGGTHLSVILTLMVWSLGATRTRATNLAHEMTAELASAKGAEERLAEIARRTSNSVVITDAEGRIEWVNEGYIRATGRRDEAVVGTNYPHLPGALTSGSVSPSSLRLDASRPSPGGAESRLSVEVTPMRDASGDLTGFMAIETDITESHRSQEALERLNSELLVAREAAEAASRSKSAFLANMSHEIRTPLTAILGFADILAEESVIGAPSSRPPEAAETIRSAGAHLLAVISDILDLSKIEAGKMTLEHMALSPVGLLRDVETMMRPRAADKGLVLSIGLASPIPDSVIGDPTRLRQIVMNLVGNAVKFTDAGSVSVTAGVDTSGHRLVLDVEDTGIGLTEEQSGRLFHAFEQADESVTRKHGGTGLGLSIASRLAGLMGGELTLSWSERGRGSRFRFTMPMELPATARYVSSVDVAKPSNQLAISVATILVGRILLAEDGPENRMLITHHLRKAAADVDVAADGRVALDMIRAAEAAGAPYDLLITDMQMPVMDGYSLATALRADGNRVPIIALTANAMAEDQQRCLDAGCDDYMSKPIDKAALIATCARWLARTPARKATPAPSRQSFQVV